MAIPTIAPLATLTERERRLFFQRRDVCGLVELKILVRRDIPDDLADRVVAFVEDWNNTYLAPFVEQEIRPQIVANP